MAEEYKEFEENILRLTGIDLNSYKEKQMKRRLDFLIDRMGQKTYTNYFKVLKENKDELENFKSYITINVSEFFRNYPQWEILQKKIIPYLIELKKGQTLNIWSAACSTGDEPYSTAILMKKHFPNIKFNILATDIDEDILSKAKKGEYYFKSIEKIPPTYINEFFTKSDKDVYTINEDIKKHVTFKKHDLIVESYSTGMDLIICRNVVIYFTEEVKNQMYRKFANCMEKDRILFIGNTEQIISSNKYGFEYIENFFYKKI
ncbi:MAG TPA: chemotaxis protein CheR [Clostridiales bacterium]|nr:MAG: chemotaxis protein CheR [Clostridiales bacterium GWD2_32_59]HAN09851.1 chemotaxis protein CheR [Clostridiales bacterium]